MTREETDSTISRAEWDRLVPLSTDRVGVRNLSLTAPVARDAWAREKPQPVYISVSLSLAQSFASAAENDDVDQSTVHYGKLSKNVLDAIEKHGKQRHLTLDDLAAVVEEAASKTISFPALVETLEIDIFLPKASLLGSGIDFQYCRAFGNDNGQDIARSLHLKDLSIPTIIGVNSHERNMKQMAIVNLWIDRLDVTKVIDFYNELEQLVVKFVEESAFETLEALATEVVSTLILHFVFRVCPGAEVRIKIEKPSAVPLADAPSIEIVRQSNLRYPLASKLVKRQGKNVPFPLQGRLDEFLSRA
ncbi:MAG: hypothetical protein M4579_002009 [Chaenotheca gracillima]|nr:MAG: hypothetical protein M4579_002009 [Chaenotheca gracillima]